MTETVTWLHISDTHFCKEKHSWDSEDVFKSFFEDLKRMQVKYNLHPDLIFFTGDVALGHIENSYGLCLKDQYEEAKKFLERILNVFPQISISNIFIVPGNHDVNRTQVLKSQTQWLESLRRDKQQNGSHIINELIKNNNLEWKTYMKRLNDYKSFLVDSGYHHLVKDPDRLIYSLIRDINGIKVGIAGLNSAWSSYGSDEDKARLWLGTYQISTAHNELRDSTFSIILSHHPSNWFTDFEDLPMNRKIENDFNFHLHGHEHHEWVTPVDNHIRIASGALYNGFKQKHGYNFVRLYPSENRGEVFLRTFNNSTWIPNIIGKKTNDEGIWELKNLNISKKKEDIVNSLPLQNYHPMSTDYGTHYIGYWIQRITDNGTVSYSLISIEYSNKKDSYSLSGIALDNKGQHRATWNSIILGFNYNLEEMYCVYRANVMNACEITGFSCYVFNRFGGKDYNDGSGYYVDIGEKIKRCYFTFTRVTDDLITKLIGNEKIDTPQGREKFIVSYHQVSGNSP